MNTPICVSVLLADHHTLVRETIGSCLALEPGFSIAGYAASAAEAVAVAERLRPDVALMNVDMPGSDCFAAVGTIRSACPHTRVICLSALRHDIYVDKALRSGASGFLSKQDSIDALLRGIRSVVAGNTCFATDIEARIVDCPERPHLSCAPSSCLAALTPREMEVLRFISQGLSKRKIAGIAHISVRTVERHAYNLMNKLRIHDRVELTRLAIREGLTEP